MQTTWFYTVKVKVAECGYPFTTVLVSARLLPATDHRGARIKCAAHLPCANSTEKLTEFLGPKITKVLPWNYAHADMFRYAVRETAKALTYMGTPVQVLED